MLFVLLATLSVFHTIRAQCTISVKTDLSYRQPVFLRNNNLWIPKHGELIWTEGESNLIACPPIDVLITQTKALTCVARSKFLLDGKPVNISSVSCSENVVGDEQSTDQLCGASGTIKHLGFIMDAVGFVKFFEVCFNLNSASVLYSRHIIHGDSISDIADDSYRVSFKSAGMPSPVRPDLAYAIGTQQLRFTELLGSSAQASKYHNGSSYLARAQMTPYADAIMITWQRATFSYVNAVPLWEKVKSGNWLTVEKSARSVANRLQEDILVYSGTYGVLSLPHANGTLIPISLDANGIVVPKFAWKIIKSSITDAAVVLITSNDPHRTSMPSEEFLCPDVCRQYGWYTASFDLFAKGYTYCCSVTSFKAIVGNIPDDADASTVLIL